MSGRRQRIGAEYHVRPGSARLKAFDLIEVVFFRNGPDDCRADSHFRGIEGEIFPDAVVRSIG